MNNVHRFVELIGIITLLLLLAPLHGLVEQLCPNSCSGHGVCRPSVAGSCQCFPGYIGVDCSLRMCASGKAWVDLPSGDDLAHAEYAECSNMGSCDRTTGLCRCREGFTGAACDMTLCPLGFRHETNNSALKELAVCSGKGRCMSLRQASTFQAFPVHRGGAEYAGWDGDNMFGCVCEEGYAGPSCQRIECPRGVDTRAYFREELQQLACECQACAGGVRFSYGGQASPVVAWDAAPAVVQHVLRRLRLQGTLQALPPRDELPTPPRPFALDAAPGSSGRRRHKVRDIVTTISLDRQLLPAALDELDPVVVR
eukprot:gene38733-47091_t